MFGLFKFQRIFILLFLLLYLLSSNTNASERLIFEHLNTTDGLSNNTILNVFLDSRDFLWVCTDDGLNRYDGYNFKVYNPLKAGSIVNNGLEILNIIEDKYGRLWVGTSEGIYIYDRVLDSFSRFQIDKSQGETDLLDYLILCMYYDDNDNLWFGTFYGLGKLNIGKKDIKKIGVSDYQTYTNDIDDSTSLSDNSVFSIIEDHDNQIWFSSYSNSIDRYNSDTNNFSSFLIGSNQFVNSSRLEKRITCDKNGNFWIYSLGKGIVLWDKSTNQFENIELRNNEGQVIKSVIVKSIIVDQLERLWIGTDGNGIIVYNLNTNKTNQFGNDNNLSNINSNAIYSIYEDNTGTIWVGTYLAGINKLAANKSGFGLVTSKGITENGLNNNIITSFCEDYNGQIWISTDGGGLNILDTKTFNFSHITHNPDNPNGLSTNTTITLFEDIDHYIWVGTYNGGLNRFDPRTKTFKQFLNNPDNPKSINNNNPWSFEQDIFNNLWIATVNGGLNLLKYGSDTFIHYEEQNEITDSPYLIGSNSLNHLFIDSKNNLWICSISGLDKVDLNEVDFSAAEPKLLFNHYIHNSNENSISKGRVSYITEDHNGDMWIGTKGGGLNKLDIKTGLFTVYTEEDGLPHNIINAIIEVDDKYLWISTNNGLSRFDTENQIFKNFGVSDGIQSPKFHKTSCLKTKDGMLFFGGVNGFNAFYPEDIKSNTFVPKVVITDFKLFNEEVEIGKQIGKRILLPKSISELDQIVLNFSENFITFGFTALNYTSPERNQYSYLMEGFDKEWRSVNSDNRNATYTNLNPGTYTFRVKASNNEGVWNETGTSISIIIYPPWWKTWWFRIIIVFLLSSIIILIFRLRVSVLTQQKNILELTVNERTQQLQNANKELKEINSIKDKFISIIAHDIMSPFNTIMGFSELILQNFKTWSENQKIETLDLIFGSSKRLYELLENLLHWSKSERGLFVLNPVKCDLFSLIDKSSSVLKYSADAKKIEIITNIPESKIEVFTDTHLINTVIRNLISNAIKFTPTNGKIIIDVQCKNQYASVSISDNGVGIPEDDIKKILNNNSFHSTEGTNHEKGTGLGLILVKEFVSKQEGEFKIESKIGIGSTFTFTIPLWSNSFNEK